MLVPIIESHQKSIFWEHCSQIDFININFFNNRFLELIGTKKRTTINEIKTLVRTS